jgi:hypothetical protein
MWPVPVVVVDEHLKDPLEALMVQNQQPVEAFRADGAHESLGHSIGLWRAKRRTNDLNPLASYLRKLSLRRDTEQEAELGHGIGQRLSRLGLAELCQRTLR